MPCGASWCDGGMVMKAKSWYVSVSTGDVNMRRYEVPEDLHRQVVSMVQNDPSAKPRPVWS